MLNVPVKGEQIVGLHFREGVEESVIVADAECQTLESLEELLDVRLVRLSVHFVVQVVPIEHIPRCENFVFAQSLVVKPKTVFDEMDAELMSVFVLNCEPSFCVGIDLENEFAEWTQLKKFCADFVFNEGQSVKELVCWDLSIT